MRSAFCAVVLVFCTLSACGNERQTPSQSFLGTFGGPALYSKAELGCLDRNGTLRTSIDSAGNGDDMWEVTEVLNESSYQCFEERVLVALIPESRKNWKCLRGELRILMAQSVESGKSLLDPLQKTLLMEEIGEGCSTD
jgi:hypothetical protein